MAPHDDPTHRALPAPQTAPGLDPDLPQGQRCPKGPHDFEPDRAPKGAHDLRCARAVERLRGRCGRFQGGQAPWRLTGSTNGTGGACTRGLR
jgi:hypothetical protein